MKKIIFSMAFMAFCGSAMAQNSAIYKAQTFADKGELEEAAKILDEALVNPKTTKLAEMYNKAAELQAQMFNPQLMKAAQGVPFDTVSFANHLDKAIQYYIKSHEADVTPDKKGKVKAKFVEANRARLMAMLDYYNYAAVFMNQCGDKARSVDFFKKYMELPKCPVFTPEQTDSIYASKQSTYDQTSSNLAILYFQEKNYDEALKFADEALKGKEINRDLYVIKMQSLLSKNDSTAWVNTLKEAVQRTGDVNFMQNLLYYYVSKNAADEATVMVDDMIKNSPDNKAAWYMKGCVDLNLKKQYAASRESFEKALAIDPDFVDANVNIAYSYLNEVRQMILDGKFKYVGATDQTISGKAKVDAYKKELDVVKSYYKKALPFMQKVRDLDPEHPKKWAYALQMIYENLEMKAEKAEIDALIESL